MLNQLIRPARGFQTMKTAYATIKGFETMRVIRRGHCICREPGAAWEVRFVTNCSGCLYSGAGHKAKRVHQELMKQSRRARGKTSKWR